MNQSDSGFQCSSPGLKNPEPAPRYNLVVIGAGTAGLVSAAGAATLGARVALIEKGLMGGDCLNVGCVPEKGIEVQTFKIPLSEVDRAILDGKEEGFAKIHVKKRTDKIVGATIVAEHSGDMISEITLAMVGGIGLGTISNVIHPYPTQAEVIRKAADAYNRTRLTPLLQKLLNQWLKSTR